MNKKGFTLVELMAVIVILALILTIAVPSVNGLVGKVQSNMYCSKVRNIEAAAKLWGNDNIDKLSKQNDIVYFSKYRVENVEGEYFKNRAEIIKVRDLVKRGYIKKEKRDDSDVPVLDERELKSMEDDEILVYYDDSRIYTMFIYNSLDDYNLCNSNDYALSNSSDLSLMVSGKGTIYYDESLSENLGDNSLIISTVDSESIIVGYSPKVGYKYSDTKCDDSSVEVTTSNGKLLFNKVKGKSLVCKVSFVPMGSSITLVNKTPSLGSLKFNSINIAPKKTKNVYFSRKDGYELKSENIVCKSINGGPANIFSASSVNDYISITYNHSDDSFNGVCEVTFTPIRKKLKVINNDPKPASMIISNSSIAAGETNLETKIQNEGITVDAISKTSIEINPKAGYNLTNVTCTNGYIDDEKVSTKDYGNSYNNKRTITISSSVLDATETVCTLSYKEQEYTVKYTTNDSNGFKIEEPALVNGERKNIIKYNGNSTIRTTLSEGYKLNSITISPSSDSFTVEEISNGYKITSVKPLNSDTTITFNVSKTTNSIQLVTIDTENNVLDASKGVKLSKYNLSFNYGSTSENVTSTITGNYDLMFGNCDNSRYVVNINGNVITVKDNGQSGNHSDISTKCTIVYRKQYVDPEVENATKKYRKETTTKKVPVSGKMGCDFTSSAERVCEYSGGNCTKENNDPWCEEKIGQSCSCDIDKKVTEEVFDHYECSKGEKIEENNTAKCYICPDNMIFNKTDRKCYYKS